MGSKRFGKLMLLVWGAGWGCGPEAGLLGQDEPVGVERADALYDGACVSIQQEYDSAYLYYDHRSPDKVYTNTLVSPPDLDAMFCLRNVSSGRFRITALAVPAVFLDAYSTCCDHEVVLRSEQTGASQWWQISPVGVQPGLYRLQQYSTGRYLDAYTTGIDPSYLSIRQAVTRPLQGNSTQWWSIFNEHCEEDCSSL